MITYKNGNLLDDCAEALVNTVNTNGIMGKGIANQFKYEFPLNYLHYRRQCDLNKVVIGKMLVYVYRGTNISIINFPTKEYWRNPSKLEWIEEGLKDLVLTIDKYNIKSIAIPALGCGEGKLNWKDVKPLIEKYLSGISIDIRVYKPL